MTPAGRSRWLVAAATLLAAAATAALGQWQLERARHKRELGAAIAARSALPPLRAAELARPGTIERQRADAALVSAPHGDAAPAAVRQRPVAPGDVPRADTAPALEPQLAAQLHRRVELAGRWIDEASVYLDNRRMGGRPGFYLYTPLRLADGRVLLVQRGWWPRDAHDRARVPSPPATTAVVHFTGRIARAPGRTLSLGRGGEAGRIRQNLDVVEYGRSKGLDLWPLLIVQLDAEVDLGAGADGEARSALAVPAGGAPDLQRDWPAPTVDVDKHYGYATQWFLLCALIVILHVWFQLIRPRLPTTRTQP